MRAHGHTTVWGTPLGVGHSHDVKGWYHELREWWTAHKAARRQAKLEALKAGWDAKRERLKPQRAEAAADMVAAEHAFSTATAIYGLTL